MTSPARDAHPGLDPDAFPHEPPADPAALGVDGRGLARAVARFRAQHRRGRFPGGQLVVRCQGRLLASEALGLARGMRGEVPALAATPRTPFLVHSAGKPLVALVIAMLEDRGLLDVEAPVAALWPAFGRHGKDAITIADVLTHRGGVLMPGLHRDYRRWPDWDAVRAAMEEARPSHPRGTLAYHPFEYGWILAEVAQRVTGERWHDWVAREIAAPAGLPALGFGACGRDPATVAQVCWLGTRPVMAGGVDVAQDFERAHQGSWFFDALLPGGGLVTDAASLAGLYDVFLAGGLTRSGVRLISAERLAAYTRCAIHGWDRSVGVPLAVGRGFLLGARWMPSVYGWWGTEACFGHAGAFSTVAFADPARALSVAIVTNGNRGRGDLLRRFAPLGHAIRRACPRV